MTGVGVYLRPYREEDLTVMARFITEPESMDPFTWTGYRSPEARRRRWEEDTFLEKDPRYLVVALDTDGTAIGHVRWRDASILSPGESWEIGILLLPEHRGKGAGTAAQQLLVDHLFSTTKVHRICANTEVENIAEQKALDRCGFRREGLLSLAAFRGGEWRDVVVHGLLREEH
ncbi:MAG: GNAT family N-acetyltransferase [Acidimicrobiales bacterium]